MATLKSMIRITDGMSPALRSMNKSLNIVLSSFEAVQRASGNAVDTKSIQAARAELAKAETGFMRVEDEIEKAKNQQENFNKELDSSNHKASTLGRTIRRFMTGAAIMLGTKKLMEQTDEYGGIQARLNLINDGQQTTDELNNKIFASARRARGEYADMANIIGKLGITASQAFSSNDEMIAFSEIMTKSFKVAGASAQEQSAAMYQLTQAMASGRLQGDEYRSILENAPMLAQAIADEMDVTLGGLKELSSEGLITAEIIKNALFNSAEEINEQFEQMPVRFSEVASQMRNEVERRLQPTFSKILTYLNSAEGQQAVETVIGGILAIVAVTETLLGVVANVGGFFAENWSMVAPIIGGVVAIMGLLELATLATTVAQWKFNAALYANPITWVIAIIIALITILYVAVGAINKFGDQSVSATGIIAGAFTVLLAAVTNTLGALTKVVFGVVDYFYNIFAAFANFFANLFNDPVGSVIRLFGDFMDTIYGMLQKVAEGLDLIFGTSLGETVKKFRVDLQTKTEEMASTYGNGSYKPVMGQMDTEALVADLGLELGRTSYTDAWSSGYSAGEGLEDSLSGLFDIPALDAAEYTMPDLSNMEGYNADTAENTASIRDAVELTNEDLKYMRDLAEQEFINRFTTAEINIESPMSFGDIRETADVDGVIDHLTVSLEEAMAIAAEGVNEDV